MLTLNVCTLQTDLYHTNLEHTNFSHSDFLYQRIVFRFHKLLDSNDLSIFFISAFEHHTVRPFSDLAQPLKLIHFENVSPWRFLVAVASIDQAKSLNYDKRFTRRRKAFVLHRKEKHKVIDSVINRTFFSFSKRYDRRMQTHTKILARVTFGFKQKLFTLSCKIDHRCNTEYRLLNRDFP